MTKLHRAAVVQAGTVLGNPVKTLEKFDQFAGECARKGAELAVFKAGLNLRYFEGSLGIAWWNGKNYTGTHDGRLIAIDAKTGMAA